MKTLEEVKSMGLIDKWNWETLQGRLFYYGQMTDCMQVRALRENGGTLFQFGLDIHDLAGGGVLVTSTYGSVYGNNIVQCVEGVLHYHHLINNRVDKGYALIVCDDGANEIQTNERDHNINDRARLDVMLEGMEEIESIR